MIPAPQPALVAAVEEDLESAMSQVAAMHDDDDDDDDDDSDDEEAIQAQMEALQRKLAQKIRQKKGKKRLSEGGESRRQAAPPNRPSAGLHAAGAHTEKKRRVAPETRPPISSASQRRTGSATTVAASHSTKAMPGRAGAAAAGAAAGAAAAPSRLANRAALAASNPSPTASQPREAALPLRKTATKRRKPVSSSSSSSSSSGAGSAGQPADNTDHVEAFTGLSIKNRIVSSGDFKGRMEGRKFVKLSELCKLLSKGKTEVHADTDWVTAGVLIKKSATKKTKTDKNFAVWTLSDLDNHEMTMFLFSPAFTEHWKEMEGTIVALLNPEVMPPNGRSNESSSLSMDNPQLLMKIGTCPDFGTCNGTKKDGARCTMPVNRKKGDYCEYHVNAAYKKAKGKRQIMNTSSNSTANRKPMPLKPGRARIRGHLSQVHGVVRVPKPESSSALVTRGERKRLPGSSAAPLDVDGIKAKLTEETWDRTSGNSQFKRTMVAMEAEKQAKVEQKARKEMAAGQRTDGSFGSSKKTATTDAGKTIFGEKTPQVAKTFNAQYYEESTGRYSATKVEHRVTGAAAKLLNCASGRNFVAPKGPTLGRGFSGGGSITLSSGNASAEEKAAAVAKAKGGIRKRDPNAAETSMKKFPAKVVAGSGSALQRVNGPNVHQVRRGMQHGGPGGPGRIAVARGVLGGMAGVPGSSKRSMMQPAAKGSMAAALGMRVDFESEAGKQLLQKRSLNVKAMEEEQFEQLERRLDAISQIEKMEKKMDEITDKQVTCFKCLDCKQLYLRKEKYCLDHNHTLEKVKSRVRFWKCKSCKWQAQTLGERMPTKPCKCGNTSYEKSSMLRKKEYKNNDPNKLQMGFTEFSTM